MTDPSPPVPIMAVVIAEPTLPAIEGISLPAARVDIAE
jgi:hypothetical protein